MARGRILYAALLLLILALAWIYGERLLYFALIVFAAMPVASLLITFIMLRTLVISQIIPKAAVKDDTGFITLLLFNPTPLPFGNMGCVLHSDGFAVETEREVSFWLAPFQTVRREVPFTAKYRGMYKVGLDAVYAVDLMGLFRLRRGLDKKTDITILPRIVDISGFPLAMTLLTQAHSRFDIKDEDYATISDIRPYIPTDSIKRVHWKLTAKRNEWLVKNFQSNALNKVTLILDSVQLPLRCAERIVLEDRIIELSMGLARYCLRKGMPVDFMVGEGHTLSCQNPSMFDPIYRIGSELAFTEYPHFNPQSMLTHYLNEASGYLNAVIMTPRLDATLYERIANAVNSGHYIAVLYFTAPIRDEDSETVYGLLSDSGMPCFRITEESLIHEERGAA
ncbi:MAG: DUF58 domain-containing protein [Defluviitaleaceae bacterium]|nr:DUF58 domain-containing protein [Defluviitaleaceae bacterium]